MALLLTVQANWDATGDLTYSELVVAVPVRLKRRLGAVVTAAWVDSPESLSGGRALWAIPKQLGRFEATAGRTILADDAGLFATFQDRPGPTLPFRLPFRLTTFQPRGDALVSTRSDTTGRLRAGGLSWEFATTGPLAILAGRRPLLTVTLADAAARFGL